MIQERSIYFAKNDFYEIIRELGGAWNDAKKRPIVCLIQLVEHNDIYWAIPIGNFNHRDEKAKARIESYMGRKSSDITSCYYHTGKTTVQSIFFMSDVVPITEKYIEREYKGFDDKLYQIKNKPLLAELERKLRRILYYEDKNPNSFRQHITDIKNYLLNENLKI